LAQSENRAAELLAAKRARKLESIPLAPAGQIASLKGAQDLFSKGEYTAAWNEACAAIARRPFHPKAWLLLSNIAFTAGDLARARQALDHALQLAPEWTEAKRFQKQIQKMRGSSRDIAGF